MNDNIQISKLLRKIIRIYSRNIKAIKYKYLNKWRTILMKKKQNINDIYFANSFNRLYEDYKYKESYLQALKLLYQIKESENYTFHPNTNKSFFSNYNNESFLLNNKINKYNRQKRNFFQNEYSKNSSLLYLNKCDSENYQNNNLKQSEKSLFNSKSSSFYNKLSKSLNSPSNNEKIDYYYNNNFSDLKSKLSFNQTKKSQTAIPIKNQKILFNNNIQKNNLNNTISKINPRNVFRFNSFQNSNDLKIRNKEFNNLFLTKSFSKNNKTHSNRNYNNSFIKYEISNYNKLNLSKSIESYISKQKSRYKILNKKNKNNSKNISNLSTDKFSLASEQLTVKAAYQQTTHVTLQSISDEKIFKMCDNYLGTDLSLEKFKSKC